MVLFWVVQGHDGAVTETQDESLVSPQRENIRVCEL